MAHTAPRPTGESVADIHKLLLDDWGEALDHGRELQDLIHNRQPIEVLEESEERNMKPVELHTGRAGGIIEHAKGLLMASPSFSMDATGIGHDEELLADQTEKVTATVFEQQLLRNDFWTAVARDTLAYGRAFLKALPLPSVWTEDAGYPVRKEGQDAKEYLQVIKEWKASEAKFPFIIQHIPALNILPLLSGSDTCMASIEEKRVLAKTLAEDLGSSLVAGMIDRDEVRWFDRLPVVEYIDTDWVGYFLTSRSATIAGSLEFGVSAAKTYDELKVFEHGLGKCPVVMIPGIRTELNDYKGRFKSFLEDAKEDLEGFDMLVSRLATMVWAYYLPSYEWKLNESSMLGKDRPEMKVNLGGVTPTWSDEVLIPLAPPQNLPPADLLMGTVDDMIQRHTLEDVLFGRVEGSAPAFQVNLRINVARSKLTPISTHMAEGITNVMDLLYRGVEWLGETVIIDGDELTVKMAKAAKGRVTASIQPKSPFDRNSDMGVAKLAMELGLPRGWTYEHILDIPNAAELRMEKLVETIEELPEVQEPMVQEILKELGFLQEEEEFTDVSAARPGEVPAELLEALSGLGGDGRGPKPPGAASQTLNPRGLLTENEQPQPTTPLAGTQ